MLRGQARGAVAQALLPEAVPEMEAELPQPEPEPPSQPEHEQEQPDPKPVAAAKGGRRPMCGRFRQLRFCGCTIPCRTAMAQVTIDEVRPGLHIGPVQAAYMWDDLAARGITHVVDLAGGKYDRSPEMEYLRIEVPDEAGADIGPAVAAALPFISAARSGGGGVLVHCVAGKSRSATVVAAWLMATEGKSATEALADLKERHERTDPNRGFRDWLAQAPAGWLAEAARGEAAAQGPSGPS